MRPQSDSFPGHIAIAVKALAAGDVTAAEKALAPIAHPPREVPRRRPLPEATRLAVFIRDSWYCRYCAGKTIYTPVMELLAGAFPQVFPFETHNWRGGVTHPAFAARSPIVDHVEPVARGGPERELANLVTACNVCNAIKADFTLEQLGWSIASPPQAPWDGLTGEYERLWETLGRPNARRHARAIANLRRAEGLA